MIVFFVVEPARSCTVSLVVRNIIKFDLASRVMSLQAPALFSGAQDVKYFFSKSEGKMLLFRVVFVLTIRCLSRPFSLQTFSQAVKKTSIYIARFMRQATLRLKGCLRYNFCPS